MKPNDQITLVENLVATSQTIQEVKQASDEQVVRRKWPMAHWIFLSHRTPPVEIWRGDGKGVLGSGPDAIAAWDDAARLTAPSVDIVKVLGNWYYLDTGYRVDGSVMSYVKTEGK